MFWGVLIVGGAGIVGYQYYLTLPEPITVIANVTAPDLTPNYKDAKPNHLEIQFVYDYDERHKDQERPSGYPSVARIDLDGEHVRAGASLSCG